MLKNRVSLVVAFAVLFVATGISGANLVQAKQIPSSVSVCVDPTTGVVARVSSSAVCVGGVQTWSASKSAPQLCWNTSSLVPANRTRLVTLASAGQCVSPLRLISAGKVVLLCADATSGALHWPVTRACEPKNIPVWVRTASPSSPSTTTPATTNVSVLPSISLSATIIRGNTWPKAVVVTTNVAGTVYFVEGDRSINSVSDITSLATSRWTQGIVLTPNVATSLSIDVDSLLNGYYRVFLVDSKGRMSAAASNHVTISITRAYETTATVRTQTLDQNASTWNTGGTYMGFISSQPVGQSFTAGLSGPLSRVSFGLTRSGTVTQFTAEIYASDGSGNATGAALASETIVGTTVPTSSGGSLTNIDFTTPVSVVAGTKYVIVLSTPDQTVMGGGGGSYRLYYQNGNSYTGGNGFLRPLTTQTVENDYVFQTYVDV